MSYLHVVGGFRFATQEGYAAWHDAGHDLARVEEFGGWFYGGSAGGGEPEVTTEELCRASAMLVVPAPASREAGEALHDEQATPEEVATGERIVDTVRKLEAEGWLTIKPDYYALLVGQAIATARLRALQQPTGDVEERIAACSRALVCAPVGESDEAADGRAHVLRRYFARPAPTGERIEAAARKLAVEFAALHNVEWDVAHADLSREILTRHFGAPSSTGDEG